MNLRVLVGGVILGLLIASPVRADLSDAYLKAHLFIQDGEASERNGDRARAIEKYTFALRIIREIKRTSPGWNSNIIAFRTKYCTDHIRSLGGAVEPERAVSAPSPSPPPQPAAMPGDETPVYTVPKPSQPAAATAGEEAPIYTVPGRYAPRPVPSPPPPAAVPAAPPPAAGVVAPPPPPPAAVPAASPEPIATPDRGSEATRDELQKIKQDGAVLKTRLHEASQRLTEMSSDDKAREQSLKQENEALKRSLAEVDADLKEAQSLAEKLRKACEEKADLEVRLRKSESQLKDAVAGNDARVQSLVKENNALKQSLAGVNEKLTEAKADSEEARKLTLEKVELEKQLAQAGGKLAEAVAKSDERTQALLKENNALKQSLAGVDEKLAKAKVDSEEARRLTLEKVELEKQLAQAGGKLAEAAAQSDERTQALLKENNALKQSLAETEEKLKAVGSSPVELRKLLDEQAGLQKQIKQLAERFSDPNPVADDRLQTLLQQNSDLRRALTNFGAGTGAGTGDGGASSTQLMALREEVSKTQLLFENARKEIEQLRKIDFSLKADLEDARLRLKAVSAASSVSPEALRTLQEESALLRAIVERRTEEDAQRKTAPAPPEPAPGNPDPRARPDQPAPAPPVEGEGSPLKAPAADMRPQNVEDNPPPVAAPPSSKQGVSTPTAPSYKLTGENAALAREAKTLFDKDDLAGAATKYEQILKTEPDNVLARSNLGVIRFRQSQLDEAEKHLRAALALDSQDAFSLSMLGIVQYRQGRDNPAKFNEAIISLTRAIAIKGDNSETHNYLGITYSQTGFQDAAEKELLRAVELKPDYADAHFNLAVVFASQTPPSIEMARRHYKQAVELGAAKDAELEKLLAK